jgi:DNA-directed RNA polymerase specialized sigma24 family protein
MPPFRLNPTELPRTHERIFVQRNADILTWALKLTRGDVALAHDLTHDAFIQFTLGCPDLDTIQNLDSYLYGVLRNLHISHLRKASRDALQTLAPGEFDSIYLVLSADCSTPVNIQNELRQIFALACRRKETSKSASILILRFFYDQLPKEIGDVSLLNTSAVYNLRSRRGEKSRERNDRIGVCLSIGRNEGAGTGAVGLRRASRVSYSRKIETSIPRGVVQRVKSSQLWPLQ